MSYRACYQCQLVFDFTGHSDGGVGAECPECGGGLEVYEIDETELAGVGHSVDAFTDATMDIDEPSDASYPGFDSIDSTVDASPEPPHDPIRRTRRLDESLGGRGNPPSDDISGGSLSGSKSHDTSGSTGDAPRKRNTRILGRAAESRSASGPIPSRAAAAGRRSATSADDAQKTTMLPQLDSTMALSAIDAASDALITPPPVVPVRPKPVLVALADDSIESADSFDFSGHRAASSGSGSTLIASAPSRPGDAATEALRSSDLGDRVFGPKVVDAFDDSAPLDFDDSLEGDAPVDELDALTQRAAAAVRRRANPGASGKAPPVPRRGDASRQKPDLRRRKRSRWPLAAVALVLVAGGGGVAAWHFGLVELRSPTGPADISVLAPREPVTGASWEARLERVLQDGHALIPVVPGSAPLQEGAFLAGGPEGLSTSHGPVPGLPSTLVPAPLVRSDNGAEWIGPLEASLERLLAESPGLLLIALDGSAATQVLTRFAYTAQKAGYRMFGLVVGRDDGEGKGQIPFIVHRAGGTLPPSGALVVRIGRLGFHVTVQSSDGKALPNAENPIIPRRPGNNLLDVRALDKRLGRLRTQYESVRAAILFANDDLPIDKLAEVMSRIRGSDAGPRYERIALGVP